MTPLSRVAPALNALHELTVVRIPKPRSAAIQRCRDEPMLAARSGIDQRQRRRQEVGRRGLEPIEEAGGSSRKRLANEPAILGQPCLVCVGSENEQTAGGQVDMPSERASSVACRPRVPAELSLHRADVDDLRLHLCDEQGVPISVKCQHVDPAMGSNTLDLDLQPHLEPHRPEAPGGVGDTPGVRGVALHRPRHDLRPDNGKLCAYSQDVQDAPGLPHGQAFDVTGFESGDPRLAHLSACPKLCLRPAGRSPSVSDRRRNRQKEPSFGLAPLAASIHRTVIAAAACLGRISQ